MDSKHAFFISLALSLFLAVWTDVKFGFWQFQIGITPTLAYLGLLYLSHLEHNPPHRSDDEGGDH